MSRRVDFLVPDDAERSACRSCGCALYWIRTDEGRDMPIHAPSIETNLLGERRGESHFAHCPDAARWRQKQRERARRRKH